MSALAVIAALAPAGPVEAAGRCGDPAQRLWCDTARSADARAGLLLRELTADEKYGLMAGDDFVGVFNPPLPGQHTGTSDGVPRLGIPTVYYSDGPVGPRQGQATPLPAAMALAATFDPGTARIHGGVVGNEAKLKGNDFVLGPTVNIMRTPLGGRTFEGYGEDPFLTSRIGVGWIRGLQAEGVVGNVKHYAANNQEGQVDQPGSNRFFVDAKIDERTLREIYLPHFEAAVREARVGTVMGAYNGVNGQRATENRHLLLDILKGDWRFDGFVLTDYEAQRSTVNAANNGLELELPKEQFYNRPALAAAVATGQIGPEVIDEHVRRILRVYFRYGLFDREAYRNDDAQIDKAAHARATRVIEERAITLLKNRGRLLPVDPARVRSIAVIGPDAADYKSGGGSSNISPFSPPVTPCEGIMRRGRQSGAQVSCAEGARPDEAAAAARGKDLAIVVASDNQTEFADKGCLELQDRCDANDAGDQDGRIRAVAGANPNTVVLLESGGPVLMPWFGDPGVRAVLEAWYPGQEGGTAIARVLFGDVDPGGRLPVSFPRAAGDIPTAGDPAAYPGAGTSVEYKEGVFVGYRHYDERRIAPLLPFGFGLSYTSFRYRDLRVVPSGRGRYRVTMAVGNSGRRRGFAAPQLYLGLPEPSPSVPQPPRALKGFAKLSLAPGRGRRVSFSLDARSLSYFDVAANRFRVAPGCYRVMAGASSRDIRAASTLAVGPAHSARSRLVRLDRGRARVRIALARGRRAVRGATVTVRGPGFARSARTDSKGRATITVRARRAGSARVSSTTCASRLRASVSQRRAVARPRLTG